MAPPMIAPVPGASVAGAGAATLQPARLAPSPNETCHECWYPIDSGEDARALVVRNGDLMGFVHLLGCSERLKTKCETYAEYRSLNARLVDLG